VQEADRARAAERNFVDDGARAFREDEDAAAQAKEEKEARQLYRLMFGFDRGCKYDKGFGYSEGFEARAEAADATRFEEEDFNAADRRPRANREANAVREDADAERRSRFDDARAQEARERRFRERDNNHRGYFGGEFGVAA